jgi:hypothetical protein
MSVTTVIFSFVLCYLFIIKLPFQTPIFMVHFSPTLRNVEVHSYKERVLIL